jgi:hypothetical protein
MWKELIERHNRNVEEKIESTPTHKIEERAGEWLLFGWSPMDGWCEMGRYSSLREAEAAMREGPERLRFYNSSGNRLVMWNGRLVQKGGGRA